MFTLLLLNGPKVVLKRVTCSLVSIQEMHPNKEVKLSGLLLKPEAAPALCCSNEKPLTNISGQGSCGEQPPPNVQHKEGSSCKCPHLIDAVGGCLGAWGFQHRLSFSRRTFHLIVAAF